MLNKGKIWNIFAGAAFAVVSFVHGATSQAATFENVLTCDNGAAVVDVDTSERRFLQLVVREPGIISYLQGNLGFGQREMIIRGSTLYGIDFGHPTGPKFIGGRQQGVFQPSDFNYFMDRNALSSSDRFTSVYREGGGLKVEIARLEDRGCAGRTIYSTQCGGEGGGYCPHYYCDGSKYTAIVSEKTWFFQSCQ